MESYNFWDITPCNLLKVNRCFGGKCKLHFLGQIISHVRVKQITSGVALRRESSLVLFNCSFSNG
jgi:hypothetical protein